MKTDKENADFRRACFKWAGIEGVSYPLKKAPKKKQQPRHERGNLPGDKYMTADEAMKELGVSRPTLSRNVRLGLLQQVKRSIKKEHHCTTKSFFTRESVQKLKQELKK